MPSTILSDVAVSSNVMNETRRMSNVLPILSIRYNKDMKTYTKTELVEGNKFLNTLHIER